MGRGWVRVSGGGGGGAEASAIIPYLPTLRHLSIKSLFVSQGICRQIGLFFISSKKKFR